MKVRWTPVANQARADIRRHIRKQSPRAAITMHKLFVEAATQLAEFPELGRNGRMPGTRELHPHRSYRLVYKVIGDTVWVLNVIHTAREWPPSAG